MNKADLPPLTLIAGPTASGKSALAMRLATQLGGVIVNADAMQVYADLRVLTARPNAAEEATVPHRLFGHVDGAVAFSAADWAEAARIALEKIWAAGQHPIVVGGTGLYIRTLLDGIAPIPAIDPAIRAEARAMDVTAAYVALSGEDPAMASRLRPSDTTRVARALEVVRSTSRSLADWQEQRVGGIGSAVALTPIVIDPPRETVVARSNARVEAMLAGGAIDEVAALRMRGLDPALPVMRAIGVRPLLRYLGEGAPLAAVADEIRVDTRAYIKRQQTWMRGQFPPGWRRIASADALGDEPPAGPA